MGGQGLVLDPALDRVTGDAQMDGDLIHRVPPLFCHSSSVAFCVPVFVG